MDPVLILTSIDAATNLVVKLIAAYQSLPDADPTIKDKLAETVAQLDQTAATVAAWRAVSLRDEGAAPSA